jgi:proteasome lid subunit RPN8/RPN11
VSDRARFSGSALRVRRSAIEAVVRHARDAAPDECCGILVGTHGDLDAAVAARNIADTPATRFLIDPRDHFDALRAARGRGADVLGFYHSHPRSDAAPSATDLAEATYADHFFLIVGLGSTPADVRLYRFSGGNFLPIPFVTVP